MPASPSWPNYADVQAFAKSSKVADGSLSSVADALDEADYSTALFAVIEKFKRDSLWYPFLGAQGVRTFDPPGPDKGPVGAYIGLNVMGGSRTLFLGGGLLSVNSIKTGIDYTNQTGQLQVVGRDCWLGPTGAPDVGEPYTQIKFRLNQYGEPQSIVIDGVWGFGLTIPEHVRMAIIRKTMADMTPLFALALTQGRASYKEGDEETRFASGRDSGPFTVERGIWEAYYEQVLTDIKRPSL